MSAIGMQFGYRDASRRKAGRTNLTDVQAQVRLARMDKRLESKAARSICGYRGPLLNAYNQRLRPAEMLRAAKKIVFQAGLTENLLAMCGDGGFGIYYRRSTGVDCAANSFRSANMFDTSALGGMQAVAHDHTTNLYATVANGQHTSVGTDAGALMQCRSRSE